MHDMNSAFNKYDSDPTPKEDRDAFRRAFRGDPSDAIEKAFQAGWLAAVEQMAQFTERLKQKQG